MTIQGQIEALEVLAAIDLELAGLGDTLSQQREELQTKKQHLEELEQLVQRGQTNIDDMERTRSELLTETRQMSMQVERSREKLSRCRTEREANAAQREVEELRKLYRDRELEIEKLVQLVDQARLEVEKTKEERDTLVSELGANEGQMSSRLKELESEEAAKEATRKQAVEKVKPQLYRRYEQVRSRRGTAVAWTSDGTCSACNMRLPPMVFQQLMRGEELGQCPSCNRILYFRRPEPETPISENPTDSQSGGP